MIKKFGYALIVSCLMAATSCDMRSKETDSEEIAEERNEKKFGEEIEDDLEFLVEATSRELMEIELAKLAEQNSTSIKVKELAVSMLRDHTRILDELKVLAAKKNVSVPETPGEKYQKNIKDIAKKRGPAFEIEYLKMLQEGYQKDVERYEKEALNGKEPEIRAFATAKVTVLKQHVDVVTALHQTIKEK